MNRTEIRETIISVLEDINADPSVRSVNQDAEGLLTALEELGCLYPYSEGLWRAFKLITGTADEELDAISMTTEILNQLDWTVQDRILSYLHQRFIYPNIQPRGIRDPRDTETRE